MAEVLYYDPQLTELDSRRMTWTVGPKGPQNGMPDLILNRITHPAGSGLFDGGCWERYSVELRWRNGQTEPTLVTVLAVLTPEDAERPTAWRMAEDRTPIRYSASATATELMEFIWNRWQNGHLMM